MKVYVFPEEIWLLFLLGKPAEDLVGVCHGFYYDLVGKRHHTRGRPRHRHLHSPYPFFSESNIRPFA